MFLLTWFDLLRADADTFNFIFKILSFGFFVFFKSLFYSFLSTYLYFHLHDSLLSFSHFLALRVELPYLFISIVLRLFPEVCSLPFKQIFRLLLCLVFELSSNCFEVNPVLPCLLLSLTRLLFPQLLVLLLLLHDLAFYRLFLSTIVFKISFRLLFHFLSKFRHLLNNFICFQLGFLISFEIDKYIFTLLRIQLYNSVVCIFHLDKLLLTLVLDLFFNCIRVVLVC